MHAYTVNHNVAIHTVVRAREQRVSPENNANNANNANPGNNANDAEPWIIT
jgi:hypothetical protein